MPVPSSREPGFEELPNETGVNTLVDVTVRILGKFDTATPATKNGDAIEDSDLVEDAIQLEGRSDIIGKIWNNNQLSEPLRKPPAGDAE